MLAATRRPDGRGERVSLGDLLKAPAANLLILAGIAFLVLAVAGDIRGQLHLDRYGRLASAGIGPVLLVIGLLIQLDVLQQTSGGVATVPTLGPSPTAGAATPTAVAQSTPLVTVLPTATPTAAQAWIDMQPKLDAAWSVDFPRVIGLLEEHLARYHQHAEAANKLYSARVDYAKELVAQCPIAARAQLASAIALAPERTEAPALLQSLNPTPAQAPASPTC
jgi:hypothetical protein